MMTLWHKLTLVFTGFVAVYLFLLTAPITDIPFRSTSIPDNILESQPDAQWHSPSAGCARFSDDSVIVFANVNVIPMDTEHVLLNQNVVVCGDRITSISATGQLTLPLQTVVIDGEGKYLVPGLIDMHVHWTPPAHHIDNGWLFLRHGVTTVRNLSGSPATLVWRERIENGILVGPTIYTTGPPLDGYPPSFESAKAVQTSEIAEKIVQEQNEVGYDFVKVYDGLTRDTYISLVGEAHRLGIPVVGHIPWEVSLEDVLKTGQELAHVSEYEKVLSPWPKWRDGQLEAPTRLVLTAVSLILMLVAVVALSRTWRSPDQQKAPVRLALATTSLSFLYVSGALLILPQALIVRLIGNSELLVALHVAAGMIGLSTVGMIAYTIRLMRKFRPSLAHLVSLISVSVGSLLLLSTLSFWMPLTWQTGGYGLESMALKTREANIWVTTTIGSSADRFQMRLVETLHRVQVPLLLGTDASPSSSYPTPGIAAHEELRMLVEIGLSPYEALRTATANPGRYLSDYENFGTISVGQRADLLLVNGNPLDDLHNLQQLEGVMLRGNWISREELDSLLSEYTN